ncbi:MAG: tape measure protein [Desulfobulbaceae bacterium]|nr:tape measure protein [Desulfobulbaceae bacterium]
MKLEKAGRISKDIADQWHDALGRRMADDLDRLKSRGSETFSAIASHAKAAIAAATFAAVTMAGKEIYQATINMERMRNALKSATGSSQQAAEEISFLRQEANRLGLDLQAAGKGFVTIAAAAKGTTLAGAGVRAIFSSVSEASAVLGLSADDTNASLLAVSQMISKGKVSAEELRGQLGERLPGAFQAAARSMGMTTSELDKMLQKGQIMADDFLPKFAAELHKTFGPDLETAAGRSEAAFNRLTNSITDLKVTIGDSGVVSGLAAIANLMAKSIGGFNYLLDKTGDLHKGREMFAGEQLDRFMDADLAERRRMIEQETKRLEKAKLKAAWAAKNIPLNNRIMSEFTPVASSPFMPDGAIESFGVSELTDEAKKAAEASQKLAERWAEIERKMRLETAKSSLDEYEQKLLAITAEAEKLRADAKKEGYHGSLWWVDQWESSQKSTAAADRQRKAMEEVAKLAKKYRDDDAKARADELRDIETSRASWDEITLATLPEHAQAIEGVRRQYNGLLSKLDDLQAAGKITIEGEMALWDALSIREAAALSELTKANDAYYQGMNEKTSAMSQFQIEAYRNMENAAEKFVKDVRTGHGDILSSFTDMLKEMADKWIANQLMMGMFGKEFGSGGDLGGLIGLGLGLVKGVAGSAFSAATGATYSGYGLNASNDLSDVAGGASLTGKLLPSFDVGTPYVPRDMVAMIHKGERIIPAAENNHGAGATFNFSINGTDAKLAARLESRIRDVVLQELREAS